MHRFSCTVQFLRHLNIRSGLIIVFNNKGAKVTWMVTEFKLLVIASRILYMQHSWATYFSTDCSGSFVLTFVIPAGFTSSVTTRMTCCSWVTGLKNCRMDFKRIRLAPSSHVKIPDFIIQHGSFSVIGSFNVFSRGFIHCSVHVGLY